MLRQSTVVCEPRAQLEDGRIEGIRGAENRTNTPLGTSDAQSRLRGSYLYAR